MTSGLKPKRFTVGLTGGIGSGKTTVANLFAERGASIVDTDVIAHSLSAPGGLAIPAIRAQFGEDYINPDGSMNRARMRQRVFADPPARKILEGILHPLIRQEADKAMKESAGDYGIYVVPLLVGSSDWKQRVTRVLVVDCPEEIQVRRVMERNRMTEEQVRAIMATQASRQDRLNAADDVIVNDDGLAKVIPEVDRLHRFYKELARRGK